MVRRSGLPACHSEEPATKNLFPIVGKILRLAALAQDDTGRVLRMVYFFP